MADSILVEPNRPHVVHQQLALRRWPAELSGFTIALLSDFHYDPYFSRHPLHAAIPMVNDLRPDLIALTGDFVSAHFIGTRKHAALAAEPCCELLRQMRAPYGLWAVLGNHDHATDPAHVTAVLRASGISVLDNQSAAIEAKGSRFWLAGVNDVLAGSADLDSAVAKVPCDEPTVLMAHEPDFADSVRSYQVDLQLSGHSHGGQVRIPFLPPLYTPPLAEKYISGLYKLGPLTLYTNPGLGTVDLPIRFNCPPEITLFTLRQTSA
jgi:predicted MPP superfamily phosphohydrolase